jgi:hypothetical protein
MAKRGSVFLSKEAQEWAAFVLSHLPEGFATKAGSDATGVTRQFFGILRDIETVTSKIDDKEVILQAKQLENFIFEQLDRFDEKGYFYVYGRGEKDMKHFTDLKQFKFGGVK